MDAPDGCHHHRHKAAGSVDVLHDLENSVLAVRVLLGKKVCHHVCGGVDLGKVIVDSAAPMAQVEGGMLKQTVAEQAGLQQFLMDVQVLAEAQSRCHLLSHRALTKSSGTRPAPRQSSQGQKLVFCAALLMKVETSFSSQCAKQSQGTSFHNGLQNNFSNSFVEQGSMLSCSQVFKGPTTNMLTCSAAEMQGKGSMMHWQLGKKQLDAGTSNL